MSDFWSRRRAAVEAEQAAEEQAIELAQKADRQAELEARSDEDILNELGLPDPDTMKEGDDFRAFLADAIPARLRTRALRRLWRVNPVLANLDGLIDYGEDYTDAARVVENLQTAYQVGKGMLARFEEEAEEQAAGGQEEPLAADSPETEEVTASDEVPESTVVMMSSEDNHNAQQVSVGDATPASDQVAGDDYVFERPARRMRFTFEGAGT